MLGETVIGSVLLIYCGVTVDEQSTGTGTVLLIILEGYCRRAIERYGYGIIGWVTLTGYDS